MTAERKATFWLGHDLRTPPVSQVGFDPLVGRLPDNRWPKHLTVIPPVWELPSESPDKIFKLLSRTLATLHAFEATPVGDASFGGEVPVTLVEGLEALHYEAMGILDLNDYREQFLSREFVGPNYNGHSSSMNGETLVLGEPIVVNSVSIFRNVDGTRFVERRIRFKE